MKHISPNPLKINSKPHGVHTTPITVNTVIEDMMEAEKSADVLYAAAYKSAYHWCEKEAILHQLSGMQMFEYYLTRLSQRGWGHFSIAHTYANTGVVEVKLEYSSFVLSQPEKPGKICNMFAGWFAGAMDWATQEKGHTAHTNCESAHCAETFCAKHLSTGNSQNHCIFTVQPAHKLI